jgi:hypothetical protein
VLNIEHMLHAAHGTTVTGETPMNIDHHAELKKYAVAADKGHYDAIVKHLGIAMKGTDSQLVACSSKDELERYRQSDHDRVR